LPSVEQLRLTPELLEKLATANEMVENRDRQNSVLIFPWSTA
jgi:hypothetical protein